MKQNIAALCNIPKAHTGGFRSSDFPVKDVDGNVITGVAEQAQRWRSHFETIVNEQAPTNVADIPVSDEYLEINTADDVSADMLNAGGEIIIRNLIESSLSLKVYVRKKIYQVIGRRG